jgi:hypothetical protein
MTTRTEQLLARNDGLRSPTPEEQIRYRDAVIAGADPLRLCPGCMEPVMKNFTISRWCEEHTDWEDAIEVSHRACGVVFRVIHP